MSACTTIDLFAHIVVEPSPDELQRLVKTCERYGYWLATPEENASGRRFAFLVLYIARWTTASNHFAIRK